MKDLLADTPATGKDSNSFALSREDRAQQVSPLRMDSCITYQLMNKCAKIKKTGGGEVKCIRTRTISSDQS